MNELREQQRWLSTTSLVVLAVIALGYGLAHTRGVLIPFVVSIFVTSILAPLMDYQILRLRFPRSLALAGALLVAILVFVALGLLILNAMQNVLASVTDYANDFAVLWQSISAQLREWRIEVSGEDLVRKVQAELPRWATSTAGNIAGIMSQGLLIVIFTGFLLAGRNPYVVRQGVYADIDTQIRSYLSTKFVISAGTGILVWLTLSLLGLPLASVFGLLAFLFNFIPNVGSIMATLLPLPTAFAEFRDNYWLIAAVVLIPGAIQMTIGNVVEPKLMGDGLKLHPVTILLALAVWGMLWGPLGMLLAVPMTAIIRIVLDRFAITRPASRLLAGELPGAGSQS